LYICVIGGHSIRLLESIIKINDVVEIGGHIDGMIGGGKGKWATVLKERI
jgi:hypothetical protein